MVRVSGGHWTFFEQSTDEKGRKIGKCLSCNASYVSNAARMVNHIKNCELIPDDEKQKFLSSPRPTIDSRSKTPSNTSVYAANVPTTHVILDTSADSKYSNPGSAIQSDTFEATNNEKLEKKLNEALHYIKYLESRLNGDDEHQNYIIQEVSEFDATNYDSDAIVDISQIDVDKTTNDTTILNDETPTYTSSNNKLNNKSNDPMERIEALESQFSGFKKLYSTKLRQQDEQITSLKSELRNYYDLLNAYHNLFRNQGNNQPNFPSFGLSSSFGLYNRSPIRRHISHSPTKIKRPRMETVQNSTTRF